MPANTVPAFTNVPVIGEGTVVTGDTGYGGTGGTAPTHNVSIVTGATNGTKVEEIVVIPLGTTVAAVVNLFIYDGTTFWLFDQAIFGAATLSQTALQARFDKVYPNLIIPSGSFLEATVTATTAAGLNVVAFGGNF
jgi:hypothetical protein